MSREFGIERYKDLAQEQTKARGPSGADGRTAPGPSVLVASTLAITATAGEEVEAISYTFAANEIEQNDMVRIEWRGDDPDSSGQGFDQVTSNIYWNNTLLDQVSPQYTSAVFTSTLMELLTNHIALSTYGTANPAGGSGLTQFTNTSFPSWRQSGGILMLTLTYSVSDVSGVTARIMKVNT